MAKNDINISANADGAQAAGRDIITNNTIISTGVIIFDPQNLADIINALYNDIYQEAEPIDDFTRPDIIEKIDLMMLATSILKIALKRIIQNLELLINFLKTLLIKNIKKI